MAKAKDEPNMQMERLMGIGPEYSFGPEIKKRLRVGTLKQIKEVGDLWRDGLLRPKYVIMQDDETKREEQITKWVQILNMITIEGFTKEEFMDSIPEQVELAVEQFLYG